MPAKKIVRKAAPGLKAKEGDVLLLIGTMKGAFLARADRSRKRWEISGPHFPGHAVYTLCFDARDGRQRLLAGVSSMHFGAMIHHSDDLGATWTQPVEANVKFPAWTKESLKQVWQLVPGVESDTIYAGVEPAALFTSEDAGETWEISRALWEHPHRPKWEPGGGGLCLHTILPHPTDEGRMHVAISTAGVYRTTNGGASWTAANSGIRAEYLPDSFPEFGQCVHKIVRHPAKPGRLFLQNHWGLYRSDDAGDSWTDIANDVPSDFGFGMAMHPADPDTVYIVPLESDGFRCVPEGKLRVYRTTDGGKKWLPLTKGLPQKDAFETVLRDSLCTDALKPAGVYFGTRSGKIFGSANDGNSWKPLFDGLPPVVCVKTAVVPKKIRKTPKKKR